MKPTIAVNGVETIFLLAAIVEGLRGNFMASGTATSIFAVATLAAIVSRTATAVGMRHNQLIIYLPPLGLRRVTADLDNVTARSTPVNMSFEVSANGSSKTFRLRPLLGLRALGRELERQSTGDLRSPTA